MGVMMQAFYWDCPKVDNKEFAWWRVRWCAMFGLPCRFLPRTDYGYCGFIKL
jgi:hypothetical protein